MKGKKRKKGEFPHEERLACPGTSRGRGKISFYRYTPTEREEGNNARRERGSRTIEGRLGPRQWRSTGGGGNEVSLAATRLFRK